MSPFTTIIELCNSVCYASSVVGIEMLATISRTGARIATTIKNSIAIPVRIATSTQKIVAAPVRTATSMQKIVAVHVKPITVIGAVKTSSGPDRRPCQAHYYRNRPNYKMAPRGSATLRFRTLPCPSATTTMSCPRSRSRYGASPSLSPLCPRDARCLWRWWLGRLPPPLPTTTFPSEPPPPLR